MLKFDLIDIVVTMALGAALALWLTAREHSYAAENVELHQLVRDQRAFIDSFLRCTPKEPNSRAIMVYSQTGKKSCEIHNGSKNIVY